MATLFGLASGYDALVYSCLHCYVTSIYVEKKAVVLFVLRRVAGLEFFLFLLFTMLGLRTIRTTMDEHFHVIMFKLIILFFKKNCLSFMSNI